MKKKQNIDVIQQFEEEVKEVTIFDKYDKYIKQVQSNFLTGIEYQEIMEMVNYIYSKTGRNYPLNASCGACVISMIKYFSSLK